jgi:[acyl-carrier-protein] S-malonyltransferase
MLAYIFPGQGSQFVGMGKDLYDNFPNSKNIFDTADRALGFSLSDICFNGPQDKLISTDNAQPAILTVSIAALEALKELSKNYSAFSLEPKFSAGLSLGEYAALVVIETLSFEDAVCLVRKRGQFMEESARNNPGKMLCIIGLSNEVVGEICKDSGCEIANLNCPGQVVISGRVTDIEKAMASANAQGAQKTVLLEVGGAFHCSLMKDAERKLAEEIRKLRFKPPKFPVVSNVTAKSEDVVQNIINNLIQQVSSSTYWQDSINFMVGRGVDCFLEIGPGSVLRGLNRKISLDIKTLSLGKSEDIRSFLDNYK